MTEAPSPGAELLLAMSPSMILPNHMIAVRRWRRMNEKNINEKIRKIFKQRRAECEERKRMTLQRTKKIPLDLLAKDWLDNIGASDELRVYLVENALPSLVLGLEDLLVEVGRNPEGTNPINYLAQHLMRNNPRYNHHMEGSSYMKGLNEVKDELRNAAYSFKHNRAAQIRSDARKRRYERQSKESLVLEELERRDGIVAKTFESWSFGDELIPMYKVQRALRSFMEDKVPKFNPELRKVCVYVTPVLDDDRKDLIPCHIYTKMVCERVEGWPIGAFLSLMEHIDECAKAVPIGDQKQKIQSSLTSLFRSIDKERNETLDRGHILALIKEFYSSVSVMMKKYINNPLDWSDKDTVYSPTPVPSLSMTRNLSNCSRSVSIALDPKPLVDITLPTVPEKPVTKAVTINDAVEEKAEPSILNELFTTDQFFTAPIAPMVDTTAPTEASDPTITQTIEPPSEHTGSTNDLTSTPLATLSTMSITYNPAPAPSLNQLSRKSLTSSPLGSSPSSLATRTITGTTSELLTNDEDAELPIDIDLMAAEEPSSLAQPREPEIDPRLDMSQFLYVTEKLLGEDPHPRALSQLQEFLEDSFQETPQQRQSRQLSEKVAAKKHAMMIKINNLFDQWDAEKLGYLDKTEIIAVLSQWQKTSTKSYNIEMAKQIVMCVEATHSQSLLREDFLGLCHSFHSLLDSDDYMDRLLDFLSLCVKTQKEDLRRERKRRRWISVVNILPTISGSNHSIYFRSFFDIIEKDFAYHGSGRLINAYVALCEHDPDAEGEEEMLKYVACTDNDKNMVLGRVLYATQKCISNQVLRTGRTVYINQIRNNNQVHLWAMDRWAVDEDRDGAFIVLPIKTPAGRVCGVVGVDTLLSPNPTQFLPHEITFIQNAVKQMGQGFFYLDSRHRFQRSIQSLMEVIPRKEGAVKECTCYVVEPVPNLQSGPSSPDVTETEYVLRCILKLSSKTQRVEAMTGTDRAPVSRSDSSFRYSHEGIVSPGPEEAGPEGAATAQRDYLFNCLDKNEAQHQRAYGTDHVAIRINNEDKQPFIIIDCDTGKDAANKLKAPQVKSISLLGDKLMEIFKQLTEEVNTDKKVFENKLEEGMTDSLRFALRFESMILEDLKKRMSNMDASALSEIKSYKEPPTIISTVIQVVLLMLNICPEDELQEWTKIKSYLNGDLFKQLQAFDPLSKEHSVDIHKVNDRLKDLTAAEVKKGSSLPTFLLYCWVIEVISIIRVGEAHLRYNVPPLSITPPPYRR